MRPVPAKSSEILKWHVNSEPFDGSFNYRSVIGKLNYLEKGPRPDIAYMTHQCAGFMSDPKIEHAKVVRRLRRHFLWTRDKGMILTPKLELGLESHVDANFSGNWDRELRVRS
jgi:hypothetical protein